MGERPPSCAIGQGRQTAGPSLRRQRAFSNLLAGLAGWGTLREVNDEAPGRRVHDQDHPCRPGASCACLPIGDRCVQRAPSSPCPVPGRSRRKIGTRWRRIKPSRRLCGWLRPAPPAHPRSARPATDLRGYRRGDGQHRRELVVVPRGRAAPEPAGYRCVAAILPAAAPRIHDAPHPRLSIEVVHPRQLRRTVTHITRSFIRVEQTTTLNRNRRPRRHSLDESRDRPPAPERTRARRARPHRRRRGTRPRPDGRATTPLGHLRHHPDPAGAGPARNPCPGARRHPHPGPTRPAQPVGPGYPGRRGRAAITGTTKPPSRKRAGPKVSRWGPSGRWSGGSALIGPHGPTGRGAPGGGAVRRRWKPPRASGAA